MTRAGLGFAPGAVPPGALVMVEIVDPFPRTVLGRFTAKTDRAFFSLGGWQPGDGDPNWPEHVEVIDARIVEREEAARWLVWAHPELSDREVVRRICSRAVDEDTRARFVQWFLSDAEVPEIRRKAAS
jgi:hypothetical protein